MSRVHIQDSHLVRSHVDGIWAPIICKAPQIHSVVKFEDHKPPASGVMEQGVLKQCVLQSQYSQNKPGHISYSLVFHPLTLLLLGIIWKWHFFFFLIKMDFLKKQIDFVC